MKRILTLLFILAGITISYSSYSQTTGPDKKKKPAAADTTMQKSNGNADGGAGITIDEGGNPRVKPNKGNKGNKAVPSTDSTATPTPKVDQNNTQSKRASSSAEKANANDEAPAPIAIDEDGISKVKKGKNSGTTAPADGQGSTNVGDTTIMAPASGVERPH